MIFAISSWFVWIFYRCRDGNNRKLEKQLTGDALESSAGCPSAGLVRKEKSVPAGTLLRSCKCAWYPKHFLVLKQTLLSPTRKNLGQRCAGLEMPITFSKVIDRLFHFAFRQHGVYWDLEGVFEFVVRHCKTLIFR